MTINLRVLSIAVAVAIGVLGAVQLAAPEALGISPVAARWLGIIGTGLGVLATFLPRVQGSSTDPAALADRVWSLPEEDRRAIGRDLAARAETEAWEARIMAPVNDEAQRLNDLAARLQAERNRAARDAEREAQHG